MEPTLTFVYVFEHLEVALIPWIIALLAGGGLGYLMGVLIHRLTLPHPTLRSYLTLFPWRSLLTWVAVVAVSSPFLLIQFGLGPKSQIATGLVVFFLIAFPWAAQSYVDLRNPSTLVEKAVSAVRTLGVLSIGITTILHFGIGIYIDLVAPLGDLPKMVLGFGVVGILLLVIDLLFGVIQFFVSRNISFHKSFYGL